MSVEAIANRVSANPGIVKTFKQSRAKQFDPMLIVTIISGILDALAQFCERVRPKPERIRRQSKVNLRRLDSGRLPLAQHREICRRAGANPSEDEPVLQAIFADISYVATDEELLEAGDQIYGR